MYTCMELLCWLEKGLDFNNERAHARRLQSRMLVGQRRSSWTVRRSSCHAGPAQLSLLYRVSHRKLTYITSIPFFRNIQNASTPARYPGGVFGVRRRWEQKGTVA